MSGPTVALVGCGKWGRHILRDLRLLGCDVPVVARSADSRDRAESGGAARIVGSVAELGRIDGAVVATSTVTHAEVVTSLLPAAVPIFVEKPLTVDVAAARRLVDAAGDRLFVMDKWRYHPGIEELGRIARAGRIGAVAGVRTERVGWGSDHDDVDATWILAPHDLSIGVEVLGTLPSPLAAVAEQDDGGAMVGLDALLGPWPWLSIRLTSRSTIRRRTVTVAGTTGIATMPDPFDPVVLVYDGVAPHDHDLPEPERVAVSDEFPLLRELRAFVEHLGGGPPPKAGAADALSAVETITTLRDMARRRS